MLINKTLSIAIGLVLLKKRIRECLRRNHKMEIRMVRKTRTTAKNANKAKSHAADATWLFYSVVKLYLLECIQSGNVLTGNQQVNVVCTFVSNYRLKIHHVTHNAVLSGNTHTT